MATKPGSRQLSWLPNNLFDTGGMPAWLATAFDTDERRAEFTKWMGDMFTQWSGAQAVNIAANSAALEINKRRSASALGTGKYLSQRQMEEIYAPEDKSTRLERLQFHGGMANGKWTNDYDVWKAASKNGHGTDSNGDAIVTKSFGFRVPTARDNIFELEAWKRGNEGKAAKTWVRESSKAAGGDYRGVRLAEDGSTQYTFGNQRTSERLTALRRLDQIENTREDDWMFDGANTDFSDRKRFADLFAASKGGDTMRDRGWLDAVFNGGLTRAALRGGRSRK